MNEAVLDASAVLALIQDERGAERLTVDVMSNAVISTVNLAEVQSKLVKIGYSPAQSWNDALELVPAVEPFTADHARTAGDLITTTEKYGLSLGDRSCLALAIALKAPVYTTEQIWRELKVGVPIHVIR
jgi:PIN domain nuclease of toxin-antitoxin system